MVERPIKKSERQAADPTSADPDQPSTSEGSTALPDGIKSASSRPVKKGDAPKSTEERGKRSDRGKKNDRGKKSEKSDAPPVNPALMRGPRPPKPSAAEPEPEASTEVEPTEAEVES